MCMQTPSHHKHYHLALWLVNINSGNKFFTAMYGNMNYYKCMIFQDASVRM